jgi:hypothetical protein
LQGADPTLEDAHGRQGKYDTWGLEQLLLICLHYTMLQVISHGVWEIWEL